MSAFNSPPSLRDRTDRAPPLSPLHFAPAIAAGLYPFLLQLFHDVVIALGRHELMTRALGGGAILLGMFAVPALGLWCAARTNQPPSMRRLAYASIVAPTAYVLLGVLLALAGSTVPDQWVWIALWAAAAVIAAHWRRTPVAPLPAVGLGRWRVAHGISAVLVLTYALFHIVNHLFGLVGADAHAAVMSIGRSAYRMPATELLLVGAMLFQVISGLCLAWRWSAVPGDCHRVFQVGSGLFLSVFILGHMNSVFIYARIHLGIPTDWAFASGAPSGLIHDAWNIRLSPHYALGVFFTAAHALSGLRVVLMAHGVARRTANVLWGGGAALSALVSAAIVAGLSGVRI